MAQFYISSTKCSLQERQTKNYGKVYDVLFRITTKDGIEKQKKLSGYKTKTLAKQAYTEFITENCELVKNNPIKRQKRAENGKEVTTINDLSKSYFLAVRNQIKDSSIYDWQNLFKLYISPTFGDCQLKDLTKESLHKWQDTIWSSKNPKNNEYYSYKYLSKIRTCFSSFLTWCENRNSDFVNLLLTIKKPKRRTPKTEMQFWTREEFEQFISVVDDQTYRALFSMLFYTGRRKGEVFALSPQDVKPTSIKFNKTLSRKTIDGRPYNITSTKNEMVDSTPICGPLQKELQNYTVPNGTFYFGGESPLAENTVSRVFNKYTELAGLKKIRIHDLRHSFVSMVISIGANLTVVASLIGDTLDQVLKTYAHLYEEDKQKIIDKI